MEVNGTRTRPESYAMCKLSLILAASLFVPHALAPRLEAMPLRTQDKTQEPLPDKRPEIADLLAKLDADVGKSTPAGDTDAVGDIDKLLQEFPRCGPKDRIAVVRGLSKCFEARRKEGEDGVANNKMYIAAARALGEMGPESTKALVSWIGQKNLRKDLLLQRYLILSLGKTRDKEGLKTLVLNLENKDASLISAAAEAMGEFTTSDIATRKEVFESLLKVLMTHKGATDAQINDQTARDRYDIIKAAIITSLGRLSKHAEQDPEEWQRWWNKNKRADWDAAQ